MSTAAPEKTLLTRAEFGPAYLKALQAVKDWTAADHPIVDWRNQVRKAISEKLIEAWFDLINVAATMDAAPNIKPAILALDAFQVALEKWAQDSEYQPEETDPSGDGDMWALWRDVGDKMNQPVRKPPEPISVLTQQSVSDRQIALIYGFLDASGEALPMMVAEERAQPGTHYNAESWVHPNERKRLEGIEKRWAERTVLVDARVSEVHSGFETPESIQELIIQKVSTEQIMKMKSCSEAEVHAVAAEMGLPVDGQLAPPIVNSQGGGQSVNNTPAVNNAAANNASNTPAIQRQQSPPPGDSSNAKSAKTLPEKVAVLHGQSLSPVVIAERLKGDHPKITPDAVSQIIASLSQESVDDI